MSSKLFYNAADRLHTDDWLSRRLIQALESIRSGSATPSLDLVLFEKELAKKDFAKPEALE